MIKLIAAINADGNIDFTPPHEDLLRFKWLTMGDTVIMGRKTWDALPKRPLPGRRNIVVSRIKKPEDIDDRPQQVLCYGTLDDAMHDNARYDDAWIIGGSDIFRQCLPVVERMYLSRFAFVRGGSIPFPWYDPKEWRTLSSDTVHSVEPDYEFTILERV